MNGRTGTQHDRTMQALNRLAKWRAHFAGWQLGTKPKGDPECDAVRDNAEVRLMLRAEVTALAMLLTKKGIFTEDEWLAALEWAADDLNRVLEERWPGVTADEHGLHLDKRVLPWMKGWKP